MRVVPVTSTERQAALLDHKARDFLVRQRTQKEDALARRLATVPGLGPIASSAFAATTPDVGAFRSARDDAAWLGLTPRAHSSGGKERLGRISKAGNVPGACVAPSGPRSPSTLRRLLYLGAMARIRARRGRLPAMTAQAPDWLDRMLARKPVKVVAIALAAPMARTVWALIARGGSYRAVPD